MCYETPKILFFLLLLYFTLLDPSAGKSLIDLSLFVTDVLGVDDTQFSITLYAFLGIRWLEPRLELDEEAWKEEESLEEMLQAGVDVDPGFLK